MTILFLDKPLYSVFKNPLILKMTINHIWGVITSMSMMKTTGRLTDQYTWRMWSPPSAGNTQSLKRPQKKITAPMKRKTWYLRMITWYANQLLMAALLCTILMLSTQDPYPQITTRDLTLHNLSATLLLLFCLHSNWKHSI